MAPNQGPYNREALRRERVRTGVKAMSSMMTFHRFRPIEDGEREGCPTVAVADDCRFLVEGRHDANASKRGGLTRISRTPGTGLGD